MPEATGVATVAGDPPARRICLGVVAGAQGVRGAVRIKSFTLNPEDIARYGPLEDENGLECFALSLVGTAKGVVVARVAGVDDRNAAEALRGRRLYLPRAVASSADGTAFV